MNCQTGTAPLLDRLPLPAPVALAMLELGEKLLTKTDWDPEDPILPVIRATYATIASYVFFNRGECIDCALI
jgi:hypothetical protein